jgi:NADH:ubiquinone oxidoreductase subunit 5 (subunit L)/multisubunit Na+/H+ antiporter MnhA subunit
MFMQTLATLAPLMILIPSIGAFINFFWGNRLSERFSSLIAIIASGSTIFVALGLLSYLTGNFYDPAVVNPPLLDDWIRIPAVGLEIPWQMRVDTLSVSMMVFISFVATLIHIYASSYMHGDSRYPRFFAYLNMFLAFMFTLIGGNNFLMMFVGWEGVGLCSYLLIGFWWDKRFGEGWRNANAARKAFIANRIGDFGVLMAVFLMFYAFQTLDFYKPTEVANAHAVEALVSGGGHAEETYEEAGAEEGGAGTEAEEDHEGSIFLVAQTEGEGEEAQEGETATEGEHTEEAVTEEDHGEDTDAAATGPQYVNNDHLQYAQLGVFNKALTLLELEEGETVETGRLTADGEPQLQSRQIDFGPFSLDIETVLIIITLFMLLGAAGKSAQIPLFVWLPDAMAGPTPVSALIHAATMVTAGVYMMVRSNVFFAHAELTSIIVTIIGSFTAIVAGFIAIGQFDVKRVLAYSTVSQLGFMVAAVGLGAYTAAMFHMITHAFFKALLFLGSGSVIHGMEHGHHHVAHAHDHGHGGGGDAHDDHSDRDTHGPHSAHLDAHESPHDETESIDPPQDNFDPQDMRNMGGLGRKMPITYWTYLIGTLALAGIWPFAGFWSKDEILADAWLVSISEGELKGYIALGLLLVAAGMTAFYMGRQIEMVFHGQPRTEAADHASESAWPMTVPLIILAFFSLFVGFINIPSGLSGIFSFGLDGVFGHHALSDFLTYSLAEAHAAPPFNPVIALTALAIGVIALFTARARYGAGKAIDERGLDPLQRDAVTGPIWSLANARLYWDEIYFRLFINPFNRISKFLADTLDWDFLHNYFHDIVLWRGFNAIGELLSRPFDLGIVDGVVNGVGRVVRGTGGVLRRSQTGYVRVYAIAFLVGVVAVVVLMLLPVLQS